jgi:flagella basal body P-ring formation protein FlgA
MPITGTHSRSIALDLKDRPRGNRTRRAVRDVALSIVRIAFIALLCTLAYSIGASAAETQARAFQSLPAIRLTAEQFVRDSAPAFVSANSKDASPQIIVNASDPDPRLQLSDCGTDLRAFTLNGAAISGRNTIGVRCADETLGAWTIYLSVNVEVERPVLVLRRPLPRDAHVSSDDVETQFRRVPGLGGSYPSDVVVLRDQHLKRATPAGSVLNGDLFARDLLVKRGQEVFLVFDVSGVAVRAPGLALADGGLSDRVRVQNRTSLKVVEGTIESGNLVRVGL